MADNSQVVAGGGDTYRSKDRSGVKTQILGLDLGIGGSTEQLSSGFIPVTQHGGTPWLVSQSGPWSMALSGSASLTFSSNTIAITGSLPAGTNSLGGVTQSGPWSVSLSGTPSVSVNLTTVAITGSLPAGSNVLGSVGQNGAWAVALTGSATISADISSVGVTGWLPAGENTIGSVRQGDAWSVAQSGDWSVTVLNPTEYSSTVFPHPIHSGGCSPYTFISDGGAKYGTIKNSEGNLYGFSAGYVSSSGACYVRLYNDMNPPASGDTPVYRFVIPGSADGAGREKVWPLGLYFSNGISFRVTQHKQDGDDTPVSANELTLNWDYK